MMQLISLWILVCLACLVAPGATVIFVVVGIVLTLLGFNWSAL